MGLYYATISPPPTGPPPLAAFITADSRDDAATTIQTHDAFDGYAVTDASIEVVHNQPTYARLKQRVQTSRLPMLAITASGDVIRR